MSRLEPYYDTVIDTHEYTPVRTASDVLPAEVLQRRIIAVDGRDAVATALDRPTLVTTGIGVNGPPHLGTVGQILTAIRFQEAGLPVQFVLADLESYHSGHDLEPIQARAERFRRFITDLGFDPDQGRLRTQAEARDVMHTAQLLARYYTPEASGYWPATDPTAWETAVEEMYETADDGPSGPTSEAGDIHSTLLHLADFLDPLMTHEYDQVLIMLGIDEHALTPWARRFKADAGAAGRIAGIHTRLITGVDGYPKMGRSAPGSSIHLGMTADRIRAALLDPANDDSHPPDSLVFQAMCLASPYGPAELDRLASLCAGNGDTWAAEKRKYADYVVALADRWTDLAPSACG